LRYWRKRGSWPGQGEGGLEPGTRCHHPGDVRPRGPALLFENIKDHENTVCKRFFTGALATYPRIALMLGLPKDTPYRQLIDIWRERSKKRIPPKIVKTAR